MIVLFLGIQGPIFAEGVDFSRPDLRKHMLYSGGGTVLAKAGCNFLVSGTPFPEEEEKSSIWCAVLPVSAVGFGKEFLIDKHAAADDLAADHIGILSGAFFSIAIGL